MAMLKKFNNIEASSWDNLDKFYNNRIEGINIQVYSFNRFFCRCGHVDSETKNNCPKCGNFKNIITKENEILNNLKNPKKYFERKEIVEKKCKIDCNDKHIDIDSYFLVLDTNENDVIFDIKNISVFHLNEFSCSGKVATYNNSYSCYGINDLPNYILDEFSKYEDIWLDKLSFFLEYIDEEKISKLKRTITNFEKIAFVGYLIRKFPNIFVEDSIKQYPNIFKSLVADIFRIYVDKKYYSEDISNTFNVHYYFSIKNVEELCSYLNLNLMENECKKTRSYHDAKDAISLYNRLVKELDFQTYNDLIDCVDFYVDNNALKVNEAVQILKQLKSIFEKKEDYSGGPLDFSKEWKYYKPNATRYSYYNYEDRIDFRTFFKIEYLKYFSIYLKENIHIMKDNFVCNFIEQIKEMLDNDIEIKEENFKIKRKNVIMNAKLLSNQYRLPEQKVELFIDMIETNPLEAMKLVANRKKLTNKEYDAFVNTIIKKI